MLHALPSALRTLLRRPTFSLVVVLTLALALGPGATILSVADAVLLRPLPYPEPEELVRLYETVRRDGLEERRTFSFPDYEAVRRGADAFVGISAADYESFVLRTEDRVERLRGTWVTPLHFEVLGISPTLGRGFGSAASYPPETGAAPAEVLLSHRLWQSRFGGRPGVLGASLRLDGDLFTVIGVLPDGFGADRALDVWLPLLSRDPEVLGNRHDRSFEVTARLAPGTTLERAQEQLDALFAGLEADWPDSNRGYGARAVSLRRELVGDLRQPVLLLSGAVALLLVIACANVANMLLAESLRRRRPSAIRLALGARPWHLYRQTLLETLLLGTAGAGLGLLLAAWGLPLLDRVSPVELPSWALVQVNLRVVLSTVVGVGLVGGLIAVGASWLDLGPTLAATRAGARSVGGEAGGHPLRRLLLAGQVALAFMVATGAVLLTSSWLELNRIDPGFDAREMVFFRASVEGEAEARLAAYGEILERVRSAPGVASAALASDAPLEGGYSALVVAAEGAEPRPDDSYGGGHRAYRHLVDRHYFSTLELPLRRGRGFGPQDHADSPAVAVVSERLARRLWPGEGDPIGRRFTFGAPEAEPEPDTLWVTVVGVAGEVRHRTLRPDPERIAEDPDLYLSLEQFPRPSVAALVRVEGDAEARLLDLRRVTEPLAASMPVFGWATLDDHLGDQLRANRFSLALMGLFATLSLLLAAVGLYGVFSQRVGERRREIGVRMALGASRGGILALVARDASAVVVAGIAAGWLGTLAAGGAASELLYGVDSGDVRLLTLAALLVAAVGVLACLAPARAASRVDPQVVLREE
ncbi:MAG: ABC transporter permease [Holophagales bacterium]|nr:ABC transporter permease [Holophagales bacterium]